MMMKKNLFLAALALVALASCTDSEFVGDNSPDNTPTANEKAIVFNSGTNAMTRADIYGASAATLLGNNFYVMGTKGTEAATSPSPTVVFNNYLVHWDDNTADKTPSNTANWEYVSVVPGTAPTANYVKLSPASIGAQTIKYWDYSAAQYDFFAFSTGSKDAVSKTTFTGEGALTNNEIGVTTMAYGTSLASGPAYTLYIPTVDALKETYITDITEVLKTNYGKEVSLKFKNLGSKVRVALYETVPGYSVKDVKFYNNTDKPYNHEGGGYVAPTTTATLISADNYGFPTKGTIAVSFPYVGTDNQGAAAYDKASAKVTPVTASSSKTLEFDALTAQLIGKELYEAEANSYLGRDLPHATFAGSSAAQFYQTVFPVSTSYALTLRVDYTLLSTDGSGEEIKVYGASAVVPDTYTKWQPNYAYTYIFKISDNTNGWTDETGTAQGLFPITFDAVVAEATDVTGEQKTITTVATPSITTYQQNHDITKDEYSKTGDKDIYVRIMDNSTLPGTLIDNLASDKSNSVIYELGADASEAKVMDALLMRTTAVGAVSTADVTGRNGLVLTNKSTNIDNTVTTIVNGVDDKPITDLTAGTTAKIDISELTASKSYAYVYVKTAKTEEINQYEPLTVTTGSAICNDRASDDFYTLTTTNITSGTELTSAKAPDKEHLYFSKTTNGTGTTTYSYISPLGKTTMPKGCIEVAKSVLEGNSTVKGNTAAAADTFYFDKYISNNGAYAVKVFKVVD